MSPHVQISHSPMWCQAWNGPGAKAENQFEGRGKDGAWETKSPKRREPHGNSWAGGKDLRGPVANRVLGGALARGRSQTTGPR